MLTDYKFAEVSYFVGLPEIRLMKETLNNKIKLGKIGVWSLHSRQWKFQLL